eukprot:88314_1
MAVSPNPPSPKRPSDVTVRADRVGRAAGAGAAPNWEAPNWEAPTVDWEALNVGSGLKEGTTEEEPNPAEGVEEKPPPNPAPKPPSRPPRRAICDLVWGEGMRFQKPTKEKGTMALH